MNISRCLNRLLPGSQWSLDANAKDLSSLVFHDDTKKLPTMEEIIEMDKQIKAEDALKEALEIKYGHIPTFLEKLCKKLNIDHSSL